MWKVLWTHKHLKIFGLFFVDFNQHVSTSVVDEWQIIILDFFKKNLKRVTHVALQTIYDSRMNASIQVDSNSPAQYDTIPHWTTNATTWQTKQLYDDNRICSMDRENNRRKCGIHCFQRTFWRLGAFKRVRNIVKFSNWQNFKFAETSKWMGF